MIDFVCNENINLRAILAMKRKATEADKPEKKLRWDVPKTASLINFYKDHPELWNPRVPEYSNDKLRLKAVESWLIENQLDPEKGNQSIWKMKKK